MKLDVRGRRAVVVGGGPAAAVRAAALLAEGAQVRVVATGVCAIIEDLARRGRLAWDAREVDLCDIEGTELLFAAPDLGEGPRAGGEHPSVTLVGAGPGDPGLMTVAGRAALEQADVVVTDRLVPIAALEWAGPGTEIIDVGKLPRGRATHQDQINELLVSQALAGRRVVRLKGGDPFVFGRGAEEVRACAQAGVPVRVLPGVSSAIAVPELAGIPVTHRGLAQGFTVISAHVPPGAEDSTLDYAAIARSGTTIVVLMGVQTLPEVAAALLEGGLDGSCPAVVIADGAGPGERVVTATLVTVAAAVAAAGLQPPAVTVIGQVAELATAPAPPDRFATGLGD